MNVETIPQFPPNTVTVPDGQSEGQQWVKRMWFRTKTN